MNQALLQLMAENREAYTRVTSCTAMDMEPPVDNRIEEGQAMVSELLMADFDISVAFWVKTADEGLWFLYLGSLLAASRRRSFRSGAAQAG